MKPRYTKRVREEAALICALRASSGLESHHRDARDADFEATLGVSPEATNLSWQAWEHVARELDWPSPIEDPWLDAEAESLIRFGWSPK